VFAQFLGWLELLASEVQFLDLGTLERSRKLNQLLADVRSTLRATHLGDEKTFRLFAGQQRAIGEAMVIDKVGGAGVWGGGPGVRRRGRLPRPVAPAPVRSVLVLLA
jgi:hypothetical protein